MGNGTILPKVYTFSRADSGKIGQKYNLQPRMGCLIISLRFLYSYF